MVEITDELELILRLGPEVDRDFDVLLARVLDLGDQELPAGIRDRKVAAALKLIIAEELAERPVETVKRWERQGHLEHGRDGARLQRQTRASSARQDLAATAG